MIKPLLSKSLKKLDAQMLYFLAKTFYDLTARYFAGEKKAAEEVLSLIYWKKIGVTK